MKSKIIKQYSCDFCKKKGLSASHISRHEKACTNNPHRICNMCKCEWAPFDYVITNLIVEFKEKIQKTISVLPQDEYYPPFYIKDNELEKYKKIEEKLKTHVNWLCEIVCGCPACMLSVIRQSDNCRILKNIFDYKKEKEMWWSEKNQEQLERDSGYYRY